MPLTTTYEVYKWAGETTETIARIEGNRVTGQSAEAVERVLREHGWPDKSPEDILVGAYVWAAKVGKNFTPERPF